MTSGIVATDPARPPAHDYATSYELATKDGSFCGHLRERFGTDALAQPTKSALVTSTALIMDWVIQQARAMYSHAPERLVGTIASVPTRNALAVWSTSGNDWIVICEGLLEYLRDSVDDLGHRFAKAFPEAMNSDLGRKLLAQTPLPGNFQTTLGSYLYFAAIAFLTGHEAGHHIAGHDSYFTGRVHAEDDGGAPDERRLTTQALELEADRIGLILCQRSMTKLLAKLWDVADYTEDQRRSYQRSLAALLSVGAMSATLWLKPQMIDWEELREKTHPPAVVRILSIFFSLSHAIQQNFGDLDETSQKWIGLMSLEVALGASIVTGSEADRVQQERLARGGEPAAIRATGIRKALHDPKLLVYMSQLEIELRSVRQHLRSRN